MNHAYKSSDLYFNKTQLSDLTKILKSLQVESHEGSTFKGSLKLDKLDPTQDLIAKALRIRDSLLVEIVPLYKKKSHSGYRVTSQVSISILEQNIPLELVINTDLARIVSYEIAGSSNVSIANQSLKVDISMEILDQSLSISGRFQDELMVDQIKVSELSLSGEVTSCGLPEFTLFGRISTPHFQSFLLVSIDPAELGIALSGSIGDISLLTLFQGLGCTKIPKTLQGPLQAIALTGNQVFEVPSQNRDLYQQKSLETIRKDFQNLGSISLGQELITAKFDRNLHIIDTQNNLHSYEAQFTTRKSLLIQPAQFYLCNRSFKTAQFDFHPGLRLEATLSIFGLSAAIKVDLELNDGILINAKLQEPFVIAHPSFLSISDHSGAEGPELSICSYKRPDHLRNELKEPHIYLNGSLCLLGLRLETLISISSVGLKFELNTSFTACIDLPLLQGSISSCLSGSFVLVKNQQFSTQLALLFTIDINFQISNISLFNFSLEAEAILELGMNQGKPFAMLKASFRINSYLINCQIKLDPINDKMALLGQTLAGEIHTQFDQIYNSVDVFIKDIERGLIQGLKTASDTAYILSKHFKLGAQELAQSLSYLGHEISEIAQLIADEFNHSIEEIATLLKDIGASFEDIGLALNNIGHAAEDLAYALSSITEWPSEIARGLSHLSSSEIAYSLNSIMIKPYDISQALECLSFDSEEISSALSEISIDLAELEDLVEGVLDDIVEVIEDVGDTVLSIFDSTEQNSREPSALEIVLKLAPITDDCNFIHEKVLSAGFTLEDSLAALKKSSIPSSKVYQLANSKIKNGFILFYTLSHAGWSPLEIMIEMKNINTSLDSMCQILKAHGAPINTLQKIGYSDLELKKGSKQAQSCISNALTLKANNGFFICSRPSEDGRFYASANIKKNADKVVFITQKHEQGPLKHGSLVYILTDRSAFLRINTKSQAYSKIFLQKKSCVFEIINHTDRHRAIRKGDCISLRAFKNQKYLSVTADSSIDADKLRISKSSKFTVG